MPNYTYLCTSCGPFSDWAQMADFARPTICPHCGGESRRDVALPQLAIMNPALRKAENRAERSGSEPRLAKKKHLAGCGCALCKLGPRTNNVRKRWSIGH